MYLEKRKRLIIWDAESILIYRIKQEIMIENIFYKSANENFYRINKGFELSGEIIPVK